jgi:hypothetical protein
MGEILLTVYALGAFFLFLSDEDWEICLMWPLVAIIRGIRKAWQR